MSLSYATSREQHCTSLIDKTRKGSIILASLFKDFTDELTWDERFTTWATRENCIKKEDVVNRV